MNIKTEDFFLIQGDSEEPFLSYDNGIWDHWKVLEKNPEDCEIGQLAELCDGRLESRNQHDFIGVHKGLVEMLLSSGMDQDIVRKVMWNIVRSGGLGELVI